MFVLGLHDETREQTRETYTEWLREQGLLKGIGKSLFLCNSYSLIKFVVILSTHYIRIFSVFYKQFENMEVDDEGNGSSHTPLEQWPSHARKLMKKAKGFKIFKHFQLLIILVQQVT